MRSTQPTFQRTFTASYNSHMHLSGFTFVRNGFTYGYPFVQSIRSLLPLVDELVVVVGDSTDGTREAVAAITDPRIVLVDSIWDEDERRHGRIFAEQSNMGLERIKGDWGIHLQVDEVLHEDAPARLRYWIDRANQRPDIEALICPFLHFWGDFSHIRNTRRTHAYEIRAFKNTGDVRSYKDSQGFRRYPQGAAADGQKMRVLRTDVPIYHYSYARHPRLMRKKANYFHRFWHDDQWVAAHAALERDFDFNEVDRLEPFTGLHPAIMQPVIEGQDWDFEYDPSRSNMRLKDRFLYQIERATGQRLFTYKNYVEVP
jgi:glycosyltransferase involved in cell wall biosynthesis